jgi:hypothetical protein
MAFNVSLCFAQNTSDGETNQTWEAYFEIVPATASSTLTLLPKEKFLNARQSERQFVIGSILESFNTKMAVVKYDNKRDLWGIDSQNNEAVLMESLDLDNPDLTKFSDKRSGQLIRNNWFMSYGGQGMFNSDYVNIGLNVRIGSFLLMDRWDMAWSTSLNVSDETITASMGVSSKYYYPMEVREQRISPYVGSGINLVYSDNIDTSETRLEASALIGVSWALGPGSMDVGLQYGKVSGFMFTVGYTFFPWGN